MRITYHFPRVLIASCLLAASLVVSGCSPRLPHLSLPQPAATASIYPSNDPSARQAYQTVMNMDVPTFVQDLRGYGQDRVPVFLSAAYFTYRAEPQYFDLLAQHHQFIEPNDLNSSIHPIVCNSPAFPTDFSYWTPDPVRLQERLCFTGTIFPYIHYLVYDASTHDINHFVTGVRD